MDVDGVEALGTAPLQPLLDEVAAATDRAALAAVLGRRQRQGRVSLFGTYVSTDAKDSSRYLVHLSQSGLGLPDESYYRDDAYAEIRTAYVAHLARLAELVGLDDPQGLAEQVMDLETALAAASWDRVTNRDAEKTYTLMTLPALQANAPGFDWEPWLAALQAPDGALAEVVVRQPGFVIAAAAAVGAAPARAVAGVAGDPHGLGVRRLPERRGRAGGLRVLRPHPVGHARAARAVEARRVARGRRAR